MRRRLRILYTQHSSGGGSTRSLFELVRGLDKDRYEPIVLFLKKSDHQEEFESLNVKVITIYDHADKDRSPRTLRGARVKNSSGKYSICNNARLLLFGDIPIAWTVARVIWKYRIDIVHQNIGLNRGVMLGARIAHKSQVHHMRLFGGYSSCSKWLMSPNQKFIFISKAVSDHFESRGVPKGQSKIIYNPIDISRFSSASKCKGIREEFSVEDDVPLISNVGRITPWKGQMYFLKALEKVAIRYPMAKALIVGSSNTSKDKQYLDALNAYIEKSPIRENIILTGLRSDIPEIMAASDVVVHSAAEPEPFGRVIAEAMAAGTPVVATRAGGVPEIIKDGETGLLVPVMDVLAMASAIEEILGNPRLSRSIADAAQKDAAERFSVRRHVEQVQNVYEELSTLGHD